MTVTVSALPLHRQGVPANTRPLEGQPTPLFTERLMCIAECDCVTVAGLASSAPASSPLLLCFSLSLSYATGKTSDLAFSGRTKRKWG